MIGRLLRLLALGALAACKPASGDSPKGSIPLEACHLTGAGAQVVDAFCGTLTVHEDRASNQGRTIDLAIAVARATGRKAAADALFILAGGPGQSARDVYPAMSGTFARINLTRDVVLLDQRGTGASGPLACPAMDEALATAGAEDVLKQAALCRDELAKHADLRDYTTTIAMDDLDDVRAALGYDKIDLYGGSYGTRAALVYLRRHPEHVRAIVLDGVAPPGWSLGETTGRDAQRAIDLLFARCAADADCSRAFPDLKGSLASLLEKHAKPETITIAHPTTAKPTQVTVSAETIASTIHDMSYVSESAALLPLLIHTAAATGDARILAAQALIFSERVNIESGMHFAVACSEDAPFLDPAKLEADNAGSYLGAGPGKRYMDVCAGWPRGEVTPADRAPVSSPAPVLLLSGEVDPVTPPSNAAAVARTLPGSLQIAVPGEGHGVLVRSCMRRIVEDFIERGSPEGLSLDCLKEARPMRFFTSFAGPQP